MAPNNVEASFSPEPEYVINSGKPDNPQILASEENYYLHIFRSTTNLLAHILIGIVVGVSLLFVFRNGLPLGATPLHIVLCVLGYQLLMGEAFLALSPDNGWSSKLKLVHKRRAHWILQLMGSGLALAGSFIKILDKTIHWNTYHGQFALVAMVFTSVSLINGLTSLYAFEFRRFLPSNLSKLTHICFGIVAFSTSAISLCYGFDKGSFRNWASDDFTSTIIAFTAIFTFIIIINPFLTFFKKSANIIKK